MSDKTGGAATRTTTSPPAFITPAVLLWARESSGYQIAEAAKAIGIKPEKLAAAEDGTGLLTMRQAEAAARRYGRPFATLFLPSPPSEDSTETLFRRLPDSPAPPWPAELALLARRVRARQTDAAEVYGLLEEAPPWRALPLDYTDDEEDLAARLRRLLGVALDEQLAWHDRTGYLPLRKWLDSVEGLGVLVMQDGTVSLELVRGVASTDDTVPAIVLNTHDDPRARVFTLVHELSHHVRFRAGLATGISDETWCNSVASHTLMPREAFATRLSEADDSGDLLTRIDNLALAFGVTPDAAAVRAHRLGLAPRADIEAVRSRIAARTRVEGSTGGGGDYYRTAVSRLSPRFTELVFSALDSQALTYPRASGLLGVKVNHLQRLRETVMNRAGLG